MVLTETILELDTSMDLGKEESVAANCSEHPPGNSVMKTLRKIEG